jgi:hypothetical protein
MKRNLKKGLFRVTLVLSIFGGLIAIPIFHFAFERRLVGQNFIESFSNFNTLSVYASLKLVEAPWIVPVGYLLAFVFGFSLVWIVYLTIRYIIIEYIVYGFKGK